MLPNIDPTTNAANVGAAVQPQVKRTESDKAIEAYNNASPAPRVKSADERVQTGGEINRKEARGAQRTAEGAPIARTGKSKTDSYLRAGQDQAEINFQLTREERAVFLGAMSGQEDPKQMTEQEQGTLQKAAERIEKLLEDATTRRTDRTDRLDKAIKEWYSRLSNGKHKVPADLIRLIQQAAAGDLNFKDADVG